ncbi:hypothetical protein B0H10DRAFT_1963844 [Mycena sp. CBHHK59/15]|nr:hypothetical protein B0H10DRAFT_1963844 [Mycena sp. CBHHK59/15]
MYHQQSQRGQNYTFCTQAEWLGDLTPMNDTPSSLTAASSELEIDVGQLEPADFADSLCNTLGLNAKLRSDLHMFLKLLKDLSRSQTIPMIYQMATNFYTQQLILNSHTDYTAIAEVLNEVKIALAQNLDLTKEQRADRARLPPAAAHSQHPCAPRVSHPLDRILGIINANKSTLKSLRLHFFYVSHAMLPLPASTTLEHLEDLYVGGHHLLSQLVGTLTIPQLRALGLDLHAPREPIEETISRLYTRSQNPLLKSLAVSYGEPSPSPFDGYVAEGRFVSWAFLGNIGETLEVLKVGGAALESLIGTLAAPDDSGPIPGGQGQPTPVWACRRLSEIYLRRCHMHAHAERDGASMLVKMVDARNPEGGGSGPGGTGAVARLMRIELDGCGLQLGGDVVCWLEGRIGKGGLVCDETHAETL